MPRSRRPKRSLFSLKKIMMPFALLTAMVMTASALGSCARQPIDHLAGMTPDLTLESFFEGETIAYGIFEDRFGNLKRRFKVNITGTVVGNTLTLDEDFLYADGESAKRVWTISREGRDAEGRLRYSGTATDIDGTAQGVVVGNGLNWAYDIDLVTDDGTLNVHFDDWIYQMDEHVALNRAYVSKFGIEIGSVTLVFLRGEAAQTLGPLDLKMW